MPDESQGKIPKPSPVVIYALEHLEAYPSAGKMVLDLGYGDGRNAFFLASKGYIVDCVDYSLVSMEEIARRAEELGLSERVRLSTDDPSRYKIDRQYDLIVCTRLLHNFNDRAHVESFVQEMKDHTNPLGVNAIEAFTNDGALKRMLENAYLFESGELRGLYDDWGIPYHYSEGVKRLSAPGDIEKPVFNTAAELVAINPKIS